MKLPGPFLVLCLLLVQFARAEPVTPDLPMPLGLRELSRLPTKGLVCAPALSPAGEGRVLAAWLLRGPDGVALQCAVLDARHDTWSLSAPQTLPAALDPGVEAEGSVRLSPNGLHEFRWQTTPAREGRGLLCRIRLVQGKPELGPLERPGAAVPAEFPDGTRLWVSRNPLPDGAMGAVQRRAAPDEEAGDEGPVVADRWSGWTPTCGGLRLATLAPRAVLAWHTGLDGEPAILLAQSPDAGQRWLQPLRCDLGHPVGPPDLVLDRDAAALLCWRETGGDDASQPPGLYFRRYASNGATTLPTLVEITRGDRLASAPRIALLEGHPGARTELLVLLPDREGLRSLLLTLPRRKELAEADRSCACTEPPGAWIQLHAHVLSVDAERRRCVLRHGPIPGLRPASPHRTLLMAPGQPAPQVDSEGLFIIDISENPWLLLSHRQLGEPAHTPASP